MLRNAVLKPTKYGFLDVVGGALAGAVFDGGSRAFRLTSSVL